MLDDERLAREIEAFVDASPLADPAPPSASGGAAPRRRVVRPRRAVMAGPTSPAPAAADVRPVMITPESRPAGPSAARRPAARAAHARAPSERARQSAPARASSGPRPPILDAESWRAGGEEEDARLERYGGRAEVVIVRIGGAPPDGLEDAAVRRLARPVGQTLRRILRAGDRVAQLAPDTFAALVVETDDDGARAVESRVRAACEPWLTAQPEGVRLIVGRAPVKRSRRVVEATATAAAAAAESQAGPPSP